jgi:hypothetical protein
MSLSEFGDQAVKPLTPAAIEARRLSVDPNTDAPAKIAAHQTDPNAHPLYITRSEAALLIAAAVQKALAEARMAVPAQQTQEQAIQFARMFP